MATITIIRKNKSKGIMTWYARVPEGEKVHFFSLGTTSKAEAKVLLQQKIKAGDFEPKEEKSTLTLAEAFNKYEVFLRNKGVKESSIGIYLNAFSSLDLIKDKLIVDVTTKDIAESFMIQNAQKKAVTYQNYKTILSCFFNFVVDVLEILPKNPISKAIPKRKKNKPIRHFWTAEQIDRILDATNKPTLRLLYAFMAFAGLRRSEAVAMTKDKIYDGCIHLVGKGDKFATIPISPRLQREIDRCKDEWKFFQDYNMLKIIAEKALPEGFDGVAHAHRFRHSFGSILIRNGINIKVVQTLMRHENISLTLDIYGHIMDSDPKEAVDKVFC